ncbi:MAG TPA: multifunctional oxoglutarate decarboxylase/oxoglutarate dehydrogenase thiamine pyrophosphate-binding subunit/dihydrolipoyllysine-residue succinyltransferase subunit, partial [Microbacterium sp.]|nr:multifunctional oxoglutarate decarboxylase/oxoglutarate dehydrogenase thiamine pyrophosphate-binding subunit/dihydrolipoyllysine-residue succinyltransferase subunit [Microbacterium sp.]
THDEQLRVLKKLNQAEAFETFLQTKYVGQKRFSLEGGESLIPLLDEILQGAAEAGLDGAAIGMAHRGRLNVLTNIAGKTYGQVFREFEGSVAIGSKSGSGDVKYHLGTSGTFVADGGEELPVYLAANPSHLETVDGVLEGIVRAKQDLKPIGSFSWLPVLVHGDAAFSGQGVVVETLQMSQLRGYRTGGTIHVVVNNQVGFTTVPQDARTSVYATDVAKTIQAPIFHVNGDDPEAVVRVSQLAFAYREKFHKDVVIDLVCYRRRGHNEGDDPSMTQPLMTNLIEAKRSVRRLYTESLVGRGDITQEEYEQAKQDFQGRLEVAFAETHAAETGTNEVVNTDAAPDASVGEPESTAVSREVVHMIGDRFVNKPEGFTVHSKLQQLLDKRHDMSRNGGIDWAFGELLAFGSLLVEGTPVRLAGQDARRGTFAQRHSVLHDRANGQEWLPLTNLSDSQGKFFAYDSLLSEYAAMAFEYGYSVERAEALVLWEAQFGDFVNGAQIMIDQFITAAEAKWGQTSSLVMLLPHGYEGQGPEHSSGRLERFLQACAEDNLIVANYSTPANYFHALRRQVLRDAKKPLILMTPKSLLRHPQAVTRVEDLADGAYQPFIAGDQPEADRLVICSGKVVYDAIKARDESGASASVARLEQFYPFPEAAVREELARFAGKPVVWLQEEPANMGAWTFVRPLFDDLLEAANGDCSNRIQYAGRRAAASPATGSARVHAAEQAAILRGALGLAD